MNPTPAMAAPVAKASVLWTNAKPLAVISEKQPHIRTDDKVFMDVKKQDDRKRTKLLCLAL